VVRALLNFVRRIDKAILGPLASRYGAE